MTNQTMEKIFLADVYECLGDKEYLTIKDAVLYKTDFLDTYRIINFDECDINLSNKIIMYPNNQRVTGTYFVKEMKNFLYMNGREIEKVMKYIK